jgi:hypothetical protein
VRITGIHASNFLSFAPDKEDGGPGGLHLTGLVRPLTILVGPNGAGKSNVLRVVEMMMGFLKDRQLDQERLAELKRLYHRNANCSHIALNLDVIFDRPEERDLFVLFFRNLLVGPSSKTTSNAFGEPGPAGKALIPDRLASLQERLSNDVEEKDIEVLFQGQFRLEVDIRNPHSDSLAFICQNSHVPLRVDIHHRYWAGMIRLPASATEGAVERPLLEAWIMAIDASCREKLGEYLTEETEVNMPAIPRFSFANLTASTGIMPVLLNIQLEQPQRVLPIRMELNQRLGREPTNTDWMGLTEVFRRLVQGQVVCIDNWFVVDKPELPGAEDSQTLSSVLLSEGNLARYLFGLKNSPDKSERELLKGMLEDYRDLTGSQIDAVMHHIPSKQVIRQHNQKPEVEPGKYVISLITDEDIPLRYSGSGRAQAAMLCALAHQHQGRVLILDEPETFLHPTLQSVFADRFMKGDAQYIVITHSSNIIPAGKLEVVRRVYSKHDNDWRMSEITPAIDDDKSKELALRKRVRRPEEAAFLFSRCTVFVEGPNEAAALPVWFDTWIKEKVHLSAEACGVVFQAANGKNGILPLLKIADLFVVNSIPLYDADVLGTDKKGENANILRGWQDYGLICSNGGKVELGKGASIALFPKCTKYRIFLCGKKLTDDFEKLPVCKDHIEEANKETGGGPLAYRYIAEHYPCPDEFVPLFDKALELAMDAPGRRMDK